MPSDQSGAASSAARAQESASEANQLPRAYQLPTEQMVDAYNSFQPDMLRYVFRSGVKWPTLKQGMVDRAPFAIPFELRGKPDAKLLAIDLPGGPGSTQNSGWKEKFDIGQYRVIVADWRGVGNSTPLGLTEPNTIEDLVEDIEALRAACARTPDEKMVIRGGSWGMTVACAYAAKYPDKVAGMVLRLPFLARRFDSQWNYSPNGALAKQYPEAFARFTAIAPAGADMDGIMAAYASALNSNDDAVREAYCAFTDWENARGGETQVIDRSTVDLENPAVQQRVARAKLMVAYTQRDFDLGEDGIVPRLLKIPQDIPIIVAAHSDDPLCGPDTLGTVQWALPQAEVLVKQANYHWVSPAAQDPSRGFDNSFVTQADPFGTSRIGLMLSGAVMQPLPRPAVRTSATGLVTAATPDKLTA